MGSDCIDGRRAASRPGAVHLFFSELESPSFFSELEFSEFTFSEFEFFRLAVPMSTTRMTSQRLSAYT